MAILGIDDFMVRLGSQCSTESDNNAKNAKNTKRARRTCEEVSDCNHDTTYLDNPVSLTGRGNLTNRIPKRDREVESTGEIGERAVESQE